jgi:N-methylhydantoinase A
MAFTVAVDIGGTFTDLLGYDSESGRLISAKTSTTPDDFTHGIDHCFAKIEPAVGDVDTFVHGSTVAINTVVERKGARTALVVSRGMRDVYIIGRGNRPDAYDVWFNRPRPLVPRHLTFELRERLAADGAVRIPFDAGQARDVAAQIAASGVEAVAVCLLHSWNNPAHEKLMSALLQETAPALYVTASHEILREYGEYERTSTTVLNAYTGPRIRGYIDALDRRLRGTGFTGDLLIMQSNGGVMTPAVARTLPVATLESGPVGGFIAAARIGARLGQHDVIAFDMGGTTAKTNVVRNGEPQMAHGYHIGGYATGHPMTLPVVDTVEVGSGGGSIATADHLGLRVGPQSAGADPGPACYGKGGLAPTVTDANVVLGRIDPRAFLGGEMALDVDAAGEAIRRRVAEPLGLPVEEAALAIVKIAVLNMSLAVRQVSVERGYDPRDFVMLAFGGAGPLHASEVARALHIPSIVVPGFPGQFSAAGMLMADLRYDYVRTHYTALGEADFGALARIARELSDEATGRFDNARSQFSAIDLRHTIEVRYAGQDSSLPVPVDAALLGRGDRGAIDIIHTAFNERHRALYGYNDAEQALEIVSVRLAAIGKRTHSTPAFAGDGGSAAARAASGGGKASASANATADQLAGRAPSPRPDAVRRVWFDVPMDCPIFQRDALQCGAAIAGPAIVQEYASTTLLFPGDRLEVAPTGELLVRLGAG